MGSKSRLTPSAPRSATALAISSASVLRASELPRSALVAATWLLVQAKRCTVSTTRVRLAWASLMTRVRAVLVQPAQPTSRDPSPRFLMR